VTQSSTHGRSEDRNGIVNSGQRHKLGALVDHLTEWQRIEGFKASMARTNVGEPTGVNEARDRTHVQWSRSAFPQYRSQLFPRPFCFFPVL
jgi:hypothetical protein